MIRKSNITSNHMELDESHRKSKKRKFCNGTISDEETKKLCVQPTRDFEITSHNSLQTNVEYRNNYPRKLIGLMHQLELSILCLNRRYLHELKYPSAEIKFQDSSVDKFNDIVILNNDKSVHIKVIGNHFIDCSINFTKLFTRKDQDFTVNNYFNSFVKYVINNLDSGPLKSVKNLVVYTNLNLDLSETSQALNRTKNNNFYPYKFDLMNLEESEILTDFLKTKDSENENYYQLSQEEYTENELMKNLKYSPAILKMIKEKELKDKFLSQKFEKKIKKKFLSKLVFVVNQPHREELRTVIKNELPEESNEYMQLQEKVQDSSIVTDSKILSEFYFLMVASHEMFLNKKISSVNTRGNDLSNFVSLSFADKIICFNPCVASKRIIYSQLFSKNGKNELSIHNQFSLYLENSKSTERVKFFLVYTNEDFHLTKENVFHKDKSKGFHPLKLVNLDAKSKKYKLLRKCSFIDCDKLYQFSEEDTSVILDLLIIPPFVKKDKLTQLEEEDLKREFLSKLIFAVKQPTPKELIETLKSNLDNSDVIYNYEELHELTLRWLESSKLTSTSERTMRQYLDDIKNGRSSFHNFNLKNRSEEVQFAKSVAGAEGTTPFIEFFNFITEREGRKYLEVFKRNRVSIKNVSCILNKTGVTAVKALRDLYELWFDEDGNKSLFLKSLQKNEINLATVNSILRASRSCAADAFQGLCNFLIDKDGNKSQYLKVTWEQLFYFYLYA